MRGTTLIVVAALLTGACAKKEPAAPPKPAAGGVVGRIAPDGTVRVGGEIREPRKVKDARPVYPAVAREARVQGAVVLEMLIDPQGHVSNATILRSIPLLDEAALEAVRQWEYTPTLVNGVPVSVLMTVTVNFALQ